VDLNTVVDNVIADFDLLIEEKNATITADNLPSVEAVPLHMNQLFANLIGNSLKYARKDRHPEIRIWSETLQGESVHAYPALNPNLTYHNIIVQDNGIGFLPEFSEQVFNIFQRLHRKSEFKGTGIGLAMCKKIARNHRGDIGATRSSENGAVFNVILPQWRITSI
jgi:light-regulated signal transduction histidine kinase (bacteriophytochrome)